MSHVNRRMLNTQPMVTPERGLKDELELSGLMRWALEHRYELLQRHKDLGPCESSEPQRVQCG